MQAKLLDEIRGRREPLIEDRSVLRCVQGHCSVVDEARRILAECSCTRRLMRLRSAPYMRVASKAARWYTTLLRRLRGLRGGVEAVYSTSFADFRRVFCAAVRSRFRGKQFSGL